MDDTFHAKGDVEKGVPRSSLLRLAKLDKDLIWSSIVSSTEHIDLTETSPSSSSGHKQPDADHVFLPSYPRNGSTDRWTTIKSAFRRLIERRVANGAELKELILSYNGSYRSKWDLKGLVQYCDAMSPSEWSGLCATMEKMATLALDVEKIVPPRSIPFLKQGMNASIALSRKQIASLLAHAFFCTFPMRNDDPTDAFPLPSINFSGLYKKSSILADKSKLRCILHYFNRVTSRMPTGQVVFKRQSVKDSIQWKKSKTQFTELHVSSYGSIEAENGLLQVDFANKFVGGGVLYNSCFQEQVLFLISPDLILSRLFTEYLEDDEVLIMTGSEIFSRYRGYSNNFEWMGDYVDRTSSEHGVKLTQIVAMDALRFDMGEDQSEFEVRAIERELNKAYCGFYCDCEKKTDVRLHAVSTGNWGCGVFGGDKHLKSLIQMMAAAESGRDVCYFTYGDQELVHKMFQLHKLIRNHNLTVGAVYHLIMDYVKQLKAQRSSSSVKLYDYISETLNGKPGRA